MSTNKEVMSVEAVAETVAREFCRKTPRIKQESGVEFYERLNATIFNLVESERTAQREAMAQITKLTEEYKRDWGTSYRPFASLIQEIQAITTNKIKK